MAKMISQLGETSLQQGARGNGGQHEKKMNRAPSPI